MGVIANTFQRVKQLVTQLGPYEHATPAPRPADPSHRGTAADASVSNVLSYVSSQPARSAPSGQNPAGSTPSPSGKVDSKLSAHGRGTILATPGPDKINTPMDTSTDYRSDDRTESKGVRVDARPGGGVAVPYGISESKR